MSDERDRLTAEELAIVLSHYDLGVVQEAKEFPRGSHKAAKLIVRTDRGTYLLKRRPEGKNDPFRVAFAHELQNFLAEHHFPLPHIIGTRDENLSMLRLGTHVYEVFEFIPGTTYDKSLLATYEAGKVLGLYHVLICEYHPKYQPPHGHYHNSPIVRHYLREIPDRLRAAPSVRGKEQELADACDTLMNAYDEAGRRAEELGLLQWETQIVHSDWHPGNMLFQHGHVVAVIDYDAARVQPRVMDVANGTLQFSLETGSRDPETWHDYTDEPRAKRFLRGYDEMNLLTVAELRCVPLLMQEALIAEVVMPIRNTGAFARIDGFRFLKMIARKINWLREYGAKLAEDLEH